MHLVSLDRDAATINLNVGVCADDGVFPTIAHSNTLGGVDGIYLYMEHSINIVTIDTSTKKIYIYQQLLKPLNVSISTVLLSIQVNTKFPEF